MTIQIPNVNLQALNLVLVERTETMTSFLPVLEIGEILRFTVRRNGQEGAIALRGQLLPAQLPETAKDGEQLAARVIEGSANRLTLKLLTTDELQTLNLKPEQSALNSVIEQLQSVLSSVGPQGLRARPPLSLREDVWGLRSLFPMAEEFTLPQNLFAKILGFSSENPFLKAAASVRVALNSPLSTPLLEAQKQTQTTSPLERGAGPHSLFETLQKMLLFSDESSDITPLLKELTQRFTALPPSERTSKHLMTTFAKLESEWIKVSFPELEAPPLSTPTQFRAIFSAKAGETLSLLTQLLQRIFPSQDESTDLASVLRELTLRFNSLPPSERTLKRLPFTLAKLEGELSKLPLPDLKRSFEVSTLPPFSESDPSTVQPAPLSLELLASRLDELAAVRETLVQLNPLMHALREPLVLILPFLFQGTLFEIRTALDLEERSDSEEQNRHPSPNLKRLSLSLPLPGLGPVGVELGFGEGEAILHLTASSEESRAFIEEHLEEARTLLTAHGFEKLSIYTQVGVVDPPALLWSELIHHETSVVA